MYVLTAGPIPPNPGEVCASRGLATMLANLGKQPDVVLIDTPAMLAVGDTAALAGKVDGLLFLVDMHAVGRSSLREAVHRLEQMPCRKLGVIVARQQRGEGRQSHPYYYTYGEDGSRLRKRLSAKA
jgi:Mrp family chromosome partitioning ATPase